MELIGKDFFYIFNFFLLLYLRGSQIWLNYFLDDCHSSGYITKKSWKKGKPWCKGWCKGCGVSKANRHHYGILGKKKTPLILNRFCFSGNWVLPHYYCFSSIGLLLSFCVCVCVCVCEREREREREPKIWKKNTHFNLFFCWCKWWASQAR